MDSNPGFGVASEVIRIVVEPKTFVIIGGTALGAYTQRLTVLREAEQWQLIGEDRVLIYEKTNYISFAPVDKKVAYILLFESSAGGAEFVDSEYARDFKSTKHIVSDFATYYTIHTEDGGDADFHDITLSVALIGASKGGNKNAGGDGNSGGNGNTGGGDGTCSPDNPDQPSGPDPTHPGGGTGPDPVGPGPTHPGGGTGPGPGPTPNVGGGSQPDSTSDPVIAGTFLVQSVLTSAYLTAFDTPEGQVVCNTLDAATAEYRTWTIYPHQSGGSGMLLTVGGTGRFLGKDPTGRPVPVALPVAPNTVAMPIRFIAAITIADQGRYHISLDKSDNPAMVLRAHGQLNIAGPGDIVSFAEIAVNDPAQLWRLVPA